MKDLDQTVQVHSDLDLSTSVAPCKNIQINISYVSHESIHYGYSLELPLMITYSIF